MLLSSFLQKGVRLSPGPIDPAAGLDLGGAAYWDLALMNKGTGVLPEDT